MILRSLLDHLRFRWVSRERVIFLLVVCAPLAAQVQFDRDVVMAAHGISDSPPPLTDPSPGRTYADPAWRVRLLQQFPAADVDGDGKVTEEEAVGFHLRRVRLITPNQEQEKYLLPEVKRWTELVPMRDGEKLPTEIYLPPGADRLPIVLNRTSRGRIDSALALGNQLLRAGYGFVGQDLTPSGDHLVQDVLGRDVGATTMNREQRAAYNASRSARNPAEDGYDTIAWIAQQPWCNGEIAITGYSEASFQSKHALSLNPPELRLVVASIGTLDRAARGPVGVRPGPPLSWNGPVPDPPAAWDSPAAAPPRLLGGPVAQAASDLRVHYNDRTGWFDFAVQGSLEEWKALRRNPANRALLVMGFGGHGRVSPDARLPPIYGDADLMQPEIEGFRVLRSDAARQSQPSRLYYFLMGDATDPAAPGNVWKVADDWPVKHTVMSWHLQPDGGLRPAPSLTRGSRSYLADPRAPIVAFGGARMPSNRHGPLDLRGLHDRDDVLRWDSEPLREPLEITGEASVELHVSTDAEDTMFVVTLVDIYPDGYEWPIRDNAFMLRFRNGLDAPTPARANAVYRIEIPLVATALMLAPGHRLGVRVMSSFWPAYEVHPNTWASTQSAADARSARNTIHCGPDYPSRVILPIVAPGDSIDYHATQHDW